MTQRFLADYGTRGILISVACHLFLIFFAMLFSRPSFFKFQLEELSHPYRVSVKMIESKDLRQRRVSPQKKSLSQEKLDNFARQNADQAISRGAIARTNTGYSELLPSTHIFSRVEKNTLSFESRSESPRGPTQKEATGRFYGLKGRRLPGTGDQLFDEFASSVILPVLWRKASDETHALAIVTIAKDQQLWIEELSGDPFLRTLLHRALLNADTAAKLVRDLKRHAIRRYRIILRYIPLDDPGLGLSGDTIAFTDGIVITKYLPPAMRQFSGVPIEDRHSRLAKLREQLQIKDIKESLSYRSVLRNQLLGSF